MNSYLGHLEESLGDVDNSSHLLDVVNAALDSLGVVGTGAVEDVLDLLVLALGPRLVSGTAVLDETTPNGQQADGHDGLLVHDVVLIADGVDTETSGTAEVGSLAEEAASGERVDDALSLLLGLLGGNVAGVADGSGGHGRDGSAGEDRSEKGSACSYNNNISPPRSAIRVQLTSQISTTCRGVCSGLTYRQRFAPSVRPL